LKPDFAGIGIRREFDGCTSIWIISTSARSVSTTALGVVVSRRVEVHVLGHFRVDVDGSPRTLAHSVARLVALVCLQTTDVSREWLAGTLWPDASTSTSLRRLRSTLSRLNRAVSGVMRSHNDSIGLCGDVAVDLLAARQRAHELLAPATEQPALDDRLELFEHDLLTGWYEEWIDVDREIFRNLRVHALEQSAQQLLCAGRFTAAIDACLSVLRVEPYRETTHRLLVDIYVTEGNRTKAVEHARHYDDVVRSDLGIEPTMRWGL